MLVHMCTVVITIICDALATPEREYTPNVGTVLFSPSDMDKEQWTKEEMALLRARRYFQTIIPPLGFINTFNEDYVNILLEYFRDTYSNIRREATDIETDSIMTTALSDVVGGYLKVWVLPVAKLDYYGGTISQDNIVKLFLFYDEIKQYLDTDGDGWHCPDESVLNAITINVAPSKLASNTRSIKEPCEQFAYFERTPNGLGIPLPEVYWNTKSSTMFVPLKNATLIPISDPDAGNTLIRYYDTAKSCIAATNPSEKEKFETRFQNWLSKEIVPHLKDDDVYLALGSVLTLVNKTEGICDSFIKQCTDSCRSKAKAPLRYSLFEITSRKMLIIFIILLLEVAWCIPALIYILCTKKRKECNSNVYLFIEHANSPFKSQNRTTSFLSKLTRNGQVDPRPASCKTLQDIEVQNPSTPACPCTTLTNTSNVYFAKQKQIHTDTQTQCPSSNLTTAVGTGSRSYLSSKNQCCEATAVEYFYTHKKSSSRKTKDSQAQPTYIAQMTSISQEEKYPPISSEDTRKPPPKRSARSKDIKPIPSSKRHHEHNKELKNISPVKRSNLNKDSKTSSLKLNDPNRDSITVCLKQNDSSQESKSTTLRQSDLSRDSKRLSITPFDLNQDLKTDSQKQNSNKNLKPGSPYKRHQSKESVPSSQSHTKILTPIMVDTLYDRVQVQTVKTEITGISGSNITKLTESKMLDIDEEQSSNNNSLFIAPICSCTGCLDGVFTEQEVTAGSVTELEIDVRGKDIMVSVPRAVDDNTKPSCCQESRDHKLSKPRKASFKVTDSEKPYFEITIDKPATAISVDLSGSEITKTYCSSKKRSKIPKLRSNIQQSTLTTKLPECQIVNPAAKDKPKSLIPQPKKKTVDDIALTQCCCAPPLDKLNDTL